MRDAWELLTDTIWEILGTAIALVVIIAMVVISIPRAFFKWLTQ